MKIWGKTAKISIAVMATLGCVGLVSVGTAAVVRATSQADASEYVALGDSVAAGDGLPLVTSPSTEDVVCGRSSESYPVLVAAGLHTSVSNLACSGAKAGSGIIGDQPIASAGLTVPAQLNRAFATGVPSVMTMTIGANDVHWIDLIGKCYVTTCGGLKDSATAAAYTTYFQGELAYILHGIKERSGSLPPPKVYITGYYNPVSSTACLGGSVTPSELSWVNNETDNLNKAIRQTVAATSKVSSWFRGTYNFATYVPISFSGHGLCSADPWVQGASEAAPLHPNAAGQAQIAQSLLAQIK